MASIALYNRARNWTAPVQVAELIESLPGYEILLPRFDQVARKHLSKKYQCVHPSEGGSYFVGRWLFLRLLGLVYLIAFVSLWVQIEGLIGADGILPVADYLDRVQESIGTDGYWRVPTLLWLGDGNWALHLLCGTGVVLSCALMAGVAPIPVLLLLWVCYLSLVHGGQAFLSFQWDTLLLETGFCALFIAPMAWRSTLQRGRPPRAGLWLIWLLLFKLMFLSGAVKLLSMDDTWWQLTALDVHYWTQPIPTWTSWYAHQLPAWFDKLSVLITYALEIALPFLIFAGRIGRRCVAAGAVFLMLMISWTGNYGFFNLLTVVLCVPLIDDAAWQRWLGVTMPSDPSGAPVTAVVRMRGIAGTAAAVGLIVLSALTLVREVVRTVPAGTAGTAGTVAFAERWLLSWSRPSVLRWAGPFLTINGYGLFRAMTTERPEIVVEGSRDGTSWTAYAFKWKPGDPTHRPRFAAPHMPRLDWQMWFAALDPRRAGPWLEGLMGGILRGSPDVLGLLADNPFADDPPRYVRLVYYRYQFATPDERDAQGVWWTRELAGMLTPPITRQQLRGEAE